MFRKLGLLGLSLVAFLTAVPLIVLLTRENFDSGLAIRGWVGVGFMVLLGVVFLLAALQRTRHKEEG